jgi:uncharacterized membrane protein YbhN (UPF0104 family)
VVLPSEVDWSTVWADITALSLGEVVLLVAAGLLVVLALGWTSKASLPGLTLYQGTESSATSQLSAFVFPPPADMAIRLAMYRTYGFNDEQSAAAVLIAMVARYLMVLVMPVLGLALVLVSGQGNWSGFWWFVGLGTVLLVVLWVILRVARSDSAARATGRLVERIVTWVVHLFRRSPPQDVVGAVVRFGQRTRTTLDTNGRSLVASNLAWGLSNAVVMGMVLRFSGLGPDELSVTEAVLTTGLVMAINMLPIPGKDALVVSYLAGILSLTASSDVSALGTALLLYRMITWILPMPVGLITFLAWRHRVRADKVNTVDESV